MSNTNLPTNLESNDTYAVADLGSNSFHLVIYRVQDGEKTILSKHREMVQLAAGVRDDQTLAPDTKKLALDCLKTFARLIDAIPRSQVRAVGTKTLREIRGGDFLSYAKAALGHDIDIVSGHEEARLVYLGVRTSYALTEQRLLTIDIGGASTEFAIGQDMLPDFSESLNIGCVTYAKRYALDTPQQVNSRSMKAAALDVRQKVLKLSYRLNNTSWDLCYGCSGTIKAIARLLGGGHDIAHITRDQLSTLFAQACAGELIHEQLDTPHRENVIYSGIAILKGIFDAISLSTLNVSDANLKEGLLAELTEAGVRQDVANIVVERLARKHRVDAYQSQRVHQSTIYLWDQLRKDFWPESRWGIDIERILHWACQLHEVGLDVAFKRFHKHSFYLVRHANLDGFNRMQRRVLSALLLAQRKSPTQFADVLQDQDIIHALYPALLCLRLAIALHRGRSDTLGGRLRLVPMIRGSGIPDCIHITIDFDDHSQLDNAQDDLIRSVVQTETNYWSSVSNLKVVC